MGASRRLFVEGPDDLNVVVHIAKKFGFSMDDPRARDFEVKSHDGLDRLLAVTREVLNPALEIERLGIVIDRDKTSRNNWGRLAAILEPFYELPLDLPRGGTILSPMTAGRPLVGVWLMPDNRQEGALEDFIVSMVPPADPLWAHAQSVVGALPEYETKFAPGDRTKALIRTWLAWQRKPGVPYGTAIQAGFLDGRSGDASVFADWLKALFPVGEPPAQG